MQGIWTFTQVNEAQDLTPFFRRNTQVQPFDIRGYRCPGLLATSEPSPCYIVSTPRVRS